MIINVHKFLDSCRRRSLHDDCVGFLCSSYTRQFRVYLDWTSSGPAVCKETGGNREKRRWSRLLPSKISSRQNISSRPIYKDNLLEKLRPWYGDDGEYNKLRKNKKVNEYSPRGKRKKHEILPAEWSANKNWIKLDKEGQWAYTRIQTVHENGALRHTACDPITAPPDRKSANVHQKIEWRWDGTTVRRDEQVIIFENLKQFKMIKTHRTYRQLQLHKFRQAKNKIEWLGLDFKQRWGRTQITKFERDMIVSTSGWLRRWSKRGVLIAAMLGHASVDWTAKEVMLDRSWVTAFEFGHHSLPRWHGTLTV